MVTKIKSIGLSGINSYLVNIEVSKNNGIPKFDIIGMPDISTREAKHRVRSAIINSKLKLNNKRVIVNLVPSDIKKEGGKFDLGICMGILLDEKESKKVSDTAFVGELSLDGKLKGVNGIIAICDGISNYGIKRIIVPIENIKEAKMIKDVEIIGFEDIVQVLEYIKTGKKVLNSDECIEIDNEKVNLDFSDVKGQETIKRVLEISAGGKHNCLIIGSPGIGKTMLAERFNTILPELSEEEAIDVKKIKSICGLNSKTNTPMLKKVNNCITKQRLFFGERNSDIGEIILAHKGVLFMDEFLEFPRSILESLRTIMEEKEIRYIKKNKEIILPCDFILLGAMNPCKCGYYGSDIKECKCSNSEIKKYYNKLSGPMLDRIDLQIDSSPIEYNKIKNSKNESSEEIRKRIIKAREIQRERYKEDGILFNGELSPKQIEKYIKLNADSERIIREAYKRFRLSIRAYHKLLKVARTIADLELSSDIEVKHIAEAIQYRGVENKYFYKRSNNV